MDDSVEEVEQQSHHSEPGNNIQEILLEAQRNASYKETLDCISGWGSRPQGVSKHKQKLIGERMLRKWFQPEFNMVWLESMVFSKLKSHKLTLEQQSLVDSGIRMDHWALGKTQASQPFNDLQWQLIASIDANRQASTCEILYVVNTDTPHILATCIEISGIAAEGDPQL